MSLSKLSKKCRECKYLLLCNKKRIEEHGFLSSAAQVSTEFEASPAIREFANIRVNREITYRDQLEKELTKSLYGGQLKKQQILKSLT